MNAFYTAWTWFWVTVITLTVTRGLLCMAAYGLRRLRYEHRRRMARVRDYNLIDQAMRVHDQYERERFRTALHAGAERMVSDDTIERIGKHRAVWQQPLDDQPAEIIQAVVTDAKRRQP